MSMPLNPAATTSPRMRSTMAIGASFVAVFVLSLGTDQILHALDVYPPWGQPMWEPGLNALALSYRLVFGVIGGYIVARLAPHSPMKHALIGGALGFVLSMVGAVVAIRGNFGPSWYPIALALSAVPTSWLGARIFLRRGNQ
jgi:hypothetical protein